MKDPEDRPSLSELLHKIPERVYPVGRLDFHTSGALLLTNDGDLAQALLHPSRAVPKTYVVKVNVEVGESMLNALERGVVLDDGYRTQPARVEHIRDEEGKSWIQITITEGKNRQIHRMIESLGARVNRLSRVSFAGLSTHDLRPGDIRPLTEDEVDDLRHEYLSDTKAAARQPTRKNTMDRMRERIGTLGNPAEGARSRPARGEPRDARGEQRPGRGEPRDARGEQRPARGERTERASADRASADRASVDRTAATEDVARRSFRGPDKPAPRDLKISDRPIDRGGKPATRALRAPEREARVPEREARAPDREAAARAARAQPRTSASAKRTPASQAESAPRNARAQTKKPSHRG